MMTCAKVNADYLNKQTKAENIFGETIYGSILRQGNNVSIIDFSQLSII